MKLLLFWFSGSPMECSYVFTRVHLQERLDSNYVVIVLLFCLSVLNVSSPLLSYSDILYLEYLMIVLHIENIIDFTLTLLIGITVQWMLFFL